MITMDNANYTNIHQIIDICKNINTDETITNTPSSGDAHI